MKILPPTAYILLLDDEEELRLTMQDYLEAAGHHVVGVNSAMRAEEAMANGQFDIAILDVMLPDGNGLELLEKFKQKDPNMGIILITGYAEVNTATQALRLGADDFLSKPCDIEDVVASVSQILKKVTQHNIQPSQTLPQQKQRQDINSDLVGQCPSIQRLQRSLLYFAQSGSHIFITGDAGTGKTKLANMLLSLAESPPHHFLDAHDVDTHLDLTAIQSGTLILEHIQALSDTHQSQLLNHLQQHHIRLISTLNTSAANIASLNIQQTL
ncbi:MAG: response regulator, partial [Mariprofundaceae bacterium]|nr:response regulator [Mariprofundaceae bacterium]